MAGRQAGYLSIFLVVLPTPVSAMGRRYDLEPSADAMPNSTLTTAPGRPGSFDRHQLLISSLLVLGI